MFNSTPACEAGTWVIPQFHSNVVVAVHNTPLAASASQAFTETPATGGIPYRTGTHAISISVPIPNPYAVTTTGEWRSINSLLIKIQLNAISSENTTSKSPSSVAPPFA
jgi:hypothetical protein